MNRPVLLAAAALVPLLVFAQKEPAVTSHPPNHVTHLVRLQHADPHQVWRLLRSSGAVVEADNALRVLVISGTPSSVASLEETAKAIDAETAKVPSSNVQMTVYVVGASPNAAGTEQIPAGLQSTVTQLKQLFPYASYQLLETNVTRARVGEQNRTTGALQPFKGQAETPVPTYGLQFTVTDITNSGSSATVHIDNFDFTNSIQSIRTEISTNIDVATGQKVVVGKAGAAGSNAIFLILEAKVVD
jgi:type II secretory pathway component GspD/PulD (secretin)